MSVMILVVIGASGVGKTTIVRALESRNIPGVRCFYFDSIRVPTREEMHRLYGGAEQWQQSATADWLARLRELSGDVKLAVLEGQTRPEFVLGVTPRLNIVLIDCESRIRNSRLSGSRHQPELATAQMDRWSEYLRDQANALDLRVIDTSGLTVDEAVAQLEQIVAQLMMETPH